MMRFQVVALLFTLLSVCAGQEAKPGINEPGFTCVPGKVFKHDCNTCSCDNSGTLARCTAMACPPEERTKRASEEPCSPGDVKMVLCNRCRCTPTQIWACTRKACPDAVGEVEDMNNYDKKQRLKRSDVDVFFVNYSAIPGPKSVKIQEADVEAPVDIIDDIEFEAKEPVTIHSKCSPKASYQIECNTCWCKDDGSGPKYCTRIACNPKTYKPLDRQ